MFTKIIDIRVAKKEFHFSFGMKEARFPPIVYLSAERKVLSVGDAPAQGGVATVARVFEDENLDDSFAVLEVMMRYGSRIVLGSFPLIGSVTFRISIDPDIRKDLKGFTEGLFRQAAIHAGASKVIVAGR